MRKLRRAGKIGEFVSVYVNEKQVNYFKTTILSILFFLLVLAVLFPLNGRLLNNMESYIFS